MAFPCLWSEWCRFWVCWNQSLKFCHFDLQAVFEAKNLLEWCSFLVSKASTEFIEQTLFCTSKRIVQLCNTESFESSHELQLDSPSFRVHKTKDYFFEECSNVLKRERIKVLKEIYFTISMRTWSVLLQAEIKVLLPCMELMLSSRSLSGHASLILIGSDYTQPYPNQLSWMIRVFWAVGSYALILV